jgi:hypothetical protein
MSKLTPLVLCAWLAATPLAAQISSKSRHLIRPTHPELQYVGRWDFSDPKAPECGWQGSALRLRFTGTALSAELSSGSAQEYFRVVVDGDYAGSEKIAVSGQASYLLAQGMSPGVHLVELVKETYEGTSCSFHGLELIGSGMQPQPPRPQRKIEFYGDSNLAGYSLEHEENQGGAQLIGTTLGYAGITARMFDAEYHNISVSGATLQWLNKRFDRIDRYDINSTWDFSLYEPELVVMNLGANNVGGGKSSIKSKYHAFLDDLRQVHPTAHIMLYNSWGWDYNETANYTYEVIMERGDPNMSSAIFPWLFPEWHGCEYDHAGMAEYLAQHLESQLGWTRSQPTDVMCGYGLNGNLANGSFEECAPFGGYGWRYFDRAGVERIEDPAGAHDGNHFVRLTSESIYQPNPAVNGDTLRLDVWLRAQQSGKKVDLTIDFRDQEMWTQPLFELTERKILSTTWQLYSITASAPPVTSMPVFHTRFTLRSVGSAVVDVDAATMTHL